MQYTDTARLSLYGVLVATRKLHANQLSCSSFTQEKQSLSYLKRLLVQGMEFEPYSVRQQDMHVDDIDFNDNVPPQV